MNQKGFSVLFIILGIILAIGIAGGAYYIGTLKNKPQTQNSEATFQTPEPTLSPSSTLDLSEINGFPVYPNAKFIEKKIVLPCAKESYSGFSICNAKTYIWQTQDPYGKVEDWYKNNSFGWKFSGGAGSRDSLDSDSGGSGKSTYKNGYLSYGLSLSGFPSPTTIILEIPLGPPEGN